MAASHQDRNAGLQAGADGYRTAGWVKVFGSIAVVLVIAFVALHLAGRGFRHQHSPPGASSASTQPASVPGRAQQP